MLRELRPRIAARPQRHRLSKARAQQERWYADGPFGIAQVCFMAARSIASLSLSFGLVSIPVKLYSATESGSGVSFNLLHTCGSRVKQQYLCLKENIVVERADMVKGYEFEKDRYVMFKPDELKTLENAARHTIDIVSFIPLSAVDPIYYDKAYYLAPDKRGAKPYGLLLEAMRESGRCALARWAWKGKEYVVQVRANDDGIVLQQLLYADEVRSMKELDIEKVDVQKAELNLALQLIGQIAAEDYDPAAFVDDEKQRILGAIDRKIAGNEIAESAAPEPASGQIIDLMEALRASLGGKKAPAVRGAAPPAQPNALAEVEAARSRKGPKRAAAPEASPSPARARARK
jgi:DNA end-binding protein Ku